MRLIDADVAKKAVHEEFDECLVWDESGEYTSNVIEKILEALPTVDAVPVMRCKDCKHCIRELAQGKWEGSCRYWNTHSVMLNDFCSYGERKEE